MDVRILGGEACAEGSCGADFSCFAWDGVVYGGGVQVWERKIDPLVPFPWRQRIFMVELI